MFIETQDKIISMDGIQWVEFNTSGTGAKSNPYYYIIEIHYFNGEELFLRYGRDGETAKKVYKEISKILFKKE